jgi:hypothetical protein
MEGGWWENRRVHRQGYLYLLSNRSERKRNSPQQLICDQHHVPNTRTNYCTDLFVFPNACLVTSTLCERGMPDLILTLRTRDCGQGLRSVTNDTPSRRFIDTLPAPTRRSNVRGDILSLGNKQATIVSPMGRATVPIIPPS